MLHMNIICIAQWLPGASFEFYNVPMCLHNVINVLDQANVSIFPAKI